MTATTVFVHVTTNTPKKDLHPYDRFISGLYVVTLDEDTPVDGVANAALDGFYDHVGIKVLEDFEIVVRTGISPDDEVIEQSDAYENDALTGYVGLVTHVNDIASTVGVIAGVDESTQETTFMNATLQGVGERHAMSIQTHLYIPDEVAVQGQQAIANYVDVRLDRAAQKVPGLSFAAQIGLAREYEDNAVTE